MHACKHIKATPSLFVFAFVQKQDRIFEDKISQPFISNIPVPRNFHRVTGRAFETIGIMHVFFYDVKINLPLQLTFRCMHAKATSTVSLADQACSQAPLFELDLHGQASTVIGWFVVATDVKRCG